MKSSPPPRARSIPESPLDPDGSNGGRWLGSAIATRPASARRRAPEPTLAKAGIDRHAAAPSGVEAAAAGAGHALEQALREVLKTSVFELLRGLLAEPRGRLNNGAFPERVRELPDAQDASSRDVGQLASRVDSLEARGASWSDALARVDARLRQLGARHDELSDETRTAAERLASNGDERTAWDAALRQTRESLVAGTADLKALIGRIERARYQRLIPRIRRAVNREVRPGSIVAVLSRGDNELIAFDGRKGWHFPQTESGVYAGHHPADGKAACAHLDEVRARGARYLLIPRTAFWWLDHYREFNDYLLRRCRCVLRDEHTCLLFDLGRGPLSR